MSSSWDTYDAEYRPDDAWDWLTDEHPKRVLVVGVPDDDTADRFLATFDDVRWTSDKLAVALVHRGAYLLRRGHRRDALVVLTGKDPESPTQERLRNSDGHVSFANEIVERTWPASTPLAPGTDLQAGDLVQVGGDRLGRVQDVRRLRTGHEVDVDLGAELATFAEDAVSKVAGDPRSLDFWMSRDAADARTISRTLTWLKLANPISDLLYSFAATRTTFKPYQFLPVLKLLRSQIGRLLIADEVGLGKTIEAGLIWTELEQRMPLKRVLVVVPKALQLKWQEEMRNRFMRPLKLLSNADIAEFLADLEEGKEPALHGIASLQSLRRAEDLVQRLAALRPNFDLIILDEAHEVRNAATQGHHLATVLEGCSNHLVMLSATPLNLGHDDFFNLIHLLHPGRFPDRRTFEAQVRPNAVLNDIARAAVSHAPEAGVAMRDGLKQLRALQHGAALTARPDFARLSDLAERHPLSPSQAAEAKRLVSELNVLGEVFTRTRKADVPDRKAIRIAESVEVEWTQEERDVYDGIHVLMRQRALAANVPASFIMQMPLRMACSSLAVAQNRLRERLGWDRDDVLEDYEDYESSPDSVDWSAFDGLDVLQRRLPTDSKLDALVERLKKARDEGLTQALIFSVFRGTVEYLRKELAHRGFRVDVLHGGIPFDERPNITSRFRSGDIDILISSSVGAEGLDFQFCNVLVNYDLPWNPMEIEQRIGRLDRFGQQADKIFIFNMHVPGTIETDIVERLHYRIGVFQASIGDLEPILRSEWKDVSARIFDPRLSLDQVDAELRRFEIATEGQRRHLEELEQSSGLLSSLRQLDVEGLTDNGPSDGRFIGAEELRSLLDYLMGETGGSLRWRGRRGVLRGTSQLAALVRNLDSPDVGTDLRGIIGLLRDGHEIPVTLDTGDVDAVRRELITSRHPLVRAAVARLGDEPWANARYGAVSVVTEAPVQALVEVDLVSNRGARPATELWFTAMNLANGERLPDLEREVAVALAEGRLRPATVAPDLNLASDVSYLRNEIVAPRFAVARHEREAENGALVAARREAIRASLQRQLSEKNRSLAVLRRDRRQANVIGMYAAMVRNLELDLERVDEEVAELEQLEMNRRPQAILYVVGEPHQS